MLSFYNCCNPIKTIITTEDRNSYKHYIGIDAIISEEEAINIMKEKLSPDNKLVKYEPMSMEYIPIIYSSEWVIKSNDLDEVRYVCDYLVLKGYNCLSYESILDKYGYIADKYAFCINVTTNMFISDGIGHFNMTSEFKGNLKFFFVNKEEPDEDSKSEKSMIIGEKLIKEYNNDVIHTSLDYVDVPLARSIENDVIAGGFSGNETTVSVEMIIKYVTAVMYVIKHGEDIVTDRIEDGIYRDDMVQKYYDHINSYEYEEVASLYSLYYNAMKEFFVIHTESENGIKNPGYYTGFEMPTFMDAYSMACIYDFDKKVNKSYTFMSDEDNIDMYNDLFIIENSPIKYSNMPYWMNTFLFNFLSEPFPSRLEFN